MIFSFHPQALSIDGSPHLTIEFYYQVLYRTFIEEKFTQLASYDFGIFQNDSNKVVIYDEKRKNKKFLSYYGYISSTNNLFTLWNDEEGHFGMNRADEDDEEQNFDFYS